MTQPTTLVKPSEPITVDEQNKPVEPVKSKKRTTAQKLHDPLMGAAMVSHYIYGKNVTEVPELREEMQRQRELIRTQSTEVIEEMLFGQAMALQAIFTRSAARIGEAKELNTLQAWSNIALKAQNQCQKTLMALAELKNPRPLAIIKQQNNAFNQQVNNCPSQALEKIVSKNELLEVPSCPLGLQNDEHANLNAFSSGSLGNTQPGLEPLEVIRRQA